jgi:hypothetical protein
MIFRGEVGAMVAAPLRLRADELVEVRPATASNASSARRVWLKPVRSAPAVAPR